jgi:HK97 family phage portal protein
MIFDRLRQKSKTITSSAELAEALGVGYQSSAGISVTPAEAARFAPVFSCIKVLAESVGMLPLHLFEQVDKSREKARSHRLFDLIHAAPNSYMTSQEWRETMVAHLGLRGNHYSWKNRVRGEVRELLPLNPDAVTAKLNEDWTISYDVILPGGQQVTLGEDDIFHVRLMSMDGLTGLSPITQARNTIGLGMAAERFGSHLFKNGTRPSGILSTDANPSKEQMQLMSASWKEANSGDNELRTAILGGGLKWQAISISPEDAQFLETRKYQRSEIAGIFRVPAHMINDMEKATFSNIEHQDIAFVVHTLSPWLTRIEQRIALSLLSAQERKKYFAKFNVNALLRGDMKSRAEYMWKRFQMGSLSPNDIRAFEDENPIEGGDTYWVPANMTDPEDPNKGMEMQQTDTGESNA